MALTAPEFVELLTTRCPESTPIVDEHVAEYHGELLLHLLLADLRRFAIGRAEAGDAATLARCLEAVAVGLTDGDAQVENAVAVSFVEDTAWCDRSMKPFIAAWPPPLVAEIERQRGTRPPAPGG